MIQHKRYQFPTDVNGIIVNKVVKLTEITHEHEASSISRETPSDMLSERAASAQQHWSSWIYLPTILQQAVKLLQLITRWTAESNRNPT